MSVSTMALARRYALPIAFVAGLVTAYAVSRSEPHLAASAATPVNAIVAPATASYADAVQKAAPAVVMVTVEKRGQAQTFMGFPNDPFFQRFFGPDQMPNQQRRGQQPQGPIEEGKGSGVIMTPDGTILTNDHVVDGANDVTVQLQDGREFTAKIVGTDQPSDLAVIKIAATNLPAITVADSDKVRVGDVVLAVGNPLGIGQTVTMGIISAKGRTTPSDEDPNSIYEDFLQTDAPINRGNSGGALVTTTGELVGINSQIMSPSGGSIGIGFAIPSDMAENVMSQLVATGHVHRGLLGVEAEGIDSNLAKSLGLSSVHGAIVTTVEADSPASAAGLRKGDVILKVNGQSIEDSNDLRNRISSMAPGTKVNLGVQRDGRDENVTATLSEATPEQQPSQSPSTAPKTTEQAMGMSVEALTPELARQLQVPPGTTGLVVTGVDDSGAAARANIQRGDVITQVDHQSVTSTSALREALARNTDRPALLEIQRQGQTFFVAVPRH